MAEPQNASFIPKHSKQPAKRIRTTRRIYLLGYLSYVLFFGTLLATVAVFFYSVQVSKSLDDSRTSLIAERDRFSNEQVDQVRNMEKKLTVVEQLLGSLTAPSKIFADIEASLASNMYLTSFLYEYQNNGLSLVTVSGKTMEFNQLIYQRDVFNSSPMFSDAEIAAFDYSVGVELDDEEDGAVPSLAQLLVADEEVETITYTFLASISNGLIEYEPVKDSVEASEILSVRPEGEDVDESTDEDEVSADELIQ